MGKPGRHKKGIELSAPVFTRINDLPKGLIKWLFGHHQCGLLDFENKTFIVVNFLLKEIKDGKRVNYLERISHFTYSETLEFLKEQFYINN
jgi:hypothetical protein